MPLPTQTYLNAPADDTAVEEFATKWVQARETNVYDPDTDNLAYSPDSAGYLDFWLCAIVAVAKKTEDGRHDSLLAAGLLEDFLVQHGEAYVKTVVELARQWPRFRHLLGGVWKSGIKKGVWHQIEAIRGTPW